MKQSQMEERIEKVGSIKMVSLNTFIKRVVEEIEDIGNPEKLLGKPYEQWTAEDMGRLFQLYGQEPNALSRMIFNKEYQKLVELEKEVV